MASSRNEDWEEIWNLLLQIQFHFLNKSNCWKWPPAEMRIGRVTCWVFQLSNRDSWRFFCCWYGLVRYVWGQFIPICCRCNEIFFQNRPLFPNFPLFGALETQLTFMAVGEPDYPSARFRNAANKLKPCVHLFITWDADNLWRPNWQLLLKGMRASFEYRRVGWRRFCLKNCK